MSKPRTTQDTKPEKEEKAQENTPNFEEEESPRKGVLPDDVDFRRGMGCG
jgi:hypothetical protein